MFHELLIALSGQPGAIFKITNEVDQLELTNDLSFVHPSEKELLNKICKLGGYFMRFQRFIDENSVDLLPMYKTLTKENKEKHLCGQYLHAFCVGLSVVMRPYQECLIKIEEQVMKDPHFSLSIVHQLLENYFFIFPALSDIIEKIKVKKIHGCQILELLYSASNCGIPPVKSTVEAILHCCHNVLSKQLSAWMLHGLLLDDYKEFFISDKKSWAPKDRHMNYEESDDVDSAMLDDNMPKEKSVERISLVPNLLPSYIPKRVAEKILFVGQSVQMLRETETSSSSNNCDILQGREREFLQALYVLQKRPQMCLAELEVEIDKIKLCVDQRLWKLVIEDANLFKHLRLLKEMYLIGRGELFLTFFDEATALMKGPPSNTLSYDINAAFKQSLTKILTYSEEYESLFGMTLDMSVAVDAEGEATSWDHLKVTYTPSWPLQLIFTPTVMERYNTLFNFLLRVRRTQVELQNAWVLQMTSKRTKKACTADGRVWALRNRMAFFVDNLQYYLQVDVLESQFTVLLEKLRQLHDFELIHTCHDSFLLSIMQQSFISMKPVFAILYRVLHVCMHFCELLVQSYSINAEYAKTAPLSLEFDRQTSLLFKILSNVRSHQTSPYLAQLLLRIDFNKYFTKTCTLAIS